jgi:hypothetical protein
MRVMRGLEKRGSIFEDKNAAVIFAILSDDYAKVANMELASVQDAVDKLTPYEKGRRDVTDGGEGERVKAYANQRARRKSFGGRAVPTIYEWAMHLGSSMQMVAQLLHVV